MPTRETETPQGVGDAAKTVAEHASALVRLEIELATLELKRKIVALAVGIALAAGAALFLLYMLGFVFATIAAGLATAVSTWLALLITAGILLLLAGILGALAVGRFKKGTPPVPEQAIREARLTADALKSDGTGA
jgi:membrane protein implicated in regulation of membrane protease activity